jgi:transcriptional regulator with XRE-family HTH domain
MAFTGHWKWETNMQLAQRLAQLRQNKGVSLQTVADAIGVSKAHIWGLERNKMSNPTLRLIKSLASYYGVGIDFLMSEDPSSVDADQARVHLFRESQKLSDTDLAHIQALMESLIKSRETRAGPGN